MLSFGDGMYVYVQLGFSRDRVGFVTVPGAAVYWKLACAPTFLVHYVLGTRS